MTTQPGLRTPLLLALVAASMVMPVAHERFGAPADPTAAPLSSMPALGHA